MIYVLNANLSLWLRQFEGLQLHTNLSGSIKAITCASRENGKSMKSDHQKYKIKNEKYKVKIQKNITKYSVAASLCQGGRTGNQCTLIITGATWYVAK